MLGVVACHAEFNGEIMIVDRFVLLITGLCCAVLAWASWHFAGELVSGVTVSVLLAAYVVDNVQLRRQLRGLLADRVKRESREREAVRRRLLRCLLVALDKRKDR
jgi:RsiW-degrading membrane proteinase PrsW (M82 family)